MKKIGIVIPAFNEDKNIINLINQIKKRLNCLILIVDDSTNKNTKKLFSKNKFKNVKVLEWNEECKFDIIINATSLGLNKNDNIDINFENLENEKFFYDVIYNPPETEFLKNAKKNFHRTVNGKMMFIYQAHQSFTLWHEIMPDIDEETLNIVK